MDQPDAVLGSPSVLTIVVKTAPRIVEIDLTTDSLVMHLELETEPRSYTSSHSRVVDPAIKSGRRWMALRLSCLIPSCSTSQRLCHTVIIGGCLKGFTESLRFGESHNIALPCSEIALPRTCSLTWRGSKVALTFHGPSRTVEGKGLMPQECTYLFHDHVLA